MFVLFENNFQFWCKKSGRALYIWQIFCLYETLVSNIVSVVPKQVTSRTFTSQCKLLSDWLVTWNLGFEFWKCSWEMSMWHMINYSDTYLAKNQVFFQLPEKIPICHENNVSNLIVHLYNVLLSLVFERHGFRTCSDIEIFRHPISLSSKVYLIFINDTGIFD